MVYDVFHNLDKLLLWSHLPPPLPPTATVHFDSFPKARAHLWLCKCYSPALWSFSHFFTFLSKCTCLPTQPPAYWLLPGHFEALPLHFRSAACWLLLYRLSSCVVFPFHSRLPHQSASKGEPRLIHPSSTPVPSTVPDKRQALNKEERDDYRWPSWNQTDLYRLPGWCFSHYLGPF